MTKPYYNVGAIVLAADRCDPVNVTAHATPNTRDTSWHTNVTYSCHPGYEWPNPSSVRRITCQPGGTWSNSFSDKDDCKSTLFHLAVYQSLKPGFHSNARNARKVLRKKQYASKTKSAQET